jgi:diguanylate cyclase (GGDEF)-like protein/PAS domain S-box-containing protein
VGGDVQQIDQGQLLASIAATSHDCILSVDVDGVVVWASPATLGVLGWRPEALAGSELAVVTPRQGGDLYAANLARALDDERVAPFVDVVVRRDGSSVKASVTLGPVHDAAGAVTGVTVILRDVTAELNDRRERAHVEDAAGTQARLRSALGRRGWGSAVVLDEELRAICVTPSVTRFLGYAPEDALGTTHWQAAVHPGDLAAVAAAHRRVLGGAGRAERMVLRVRQRHGGWRWIEETVTNHLDDPDIRGLVAELRDVSQRVRTEEALELSAALHRALLETSQDGILAMAPDGTVSFANERLAEILGRPLAEVQGRPALRLLGLGAWESGDAGLEVPYGRPDGEERLLVVHLRPLTSATAGSLGSLVTVADVTESRLAERTLRRQALYDSLTGLPNRYLFLDRLETAAARHLRATGRGTAVVFLDLDRFKPVNDHHGHAAGDVLLEEVARRLAGAVRATDTVGRLGGDEFAIICEDTDEQSAVLVAAKILDELSRPFVQDTEEHHVGVSIGVAVAPPHHVTELVRRADAAMYRAKQLGGGRITVARLDDVSGLPVTR